MKQDRSGADEGVLVGILIGEGHFGGDGKQPHVTLRMHVDHESLFRWIMARFGGRLYGPYPRGTFLREYHGGRHYFQWMARGTFLRETRCWTPICTRNSTAGATSAMSR